MAPYSTPRKSLGTMTEMTRLLSTIRLAQSPVLAPFILSSDKTAYLPLPKSLVLVDPFVLLTHPQESLIQITLKSLYDPTTFLFKVQQHHPSARSRAEGSQEPRTAISSTFRSLKASRF